VIRIYFLRFIYIIICIIYYKLYKIIYIIDLHISLLSVSLQPQRVHSLINEDTIPGNSGSLKSIIRGYLEVLASLDMSLPDGNLENLKERALPKLEKVEQVDELLGCLTSRKQFINVFYATLKLAKYFQNSSFDIICM